MPATSRSGEEGKETRFNPPHMPSNEESRLGGVEYDQTIADQTINVVSGKADPFPNI